MRPVPQADHITEAEHHGGRPLDASRDVALRDAALALLAEIGYDRLTIDSVAARAHASKTTIYRRWSGKAELIVDALNSLKGSHPVPDTGSLRGDLEAIARNSSQHRQLLRRPTDDRADHGLARDAELRRVVRERLIDPGHSDLKTIFERAVSRGEIRRRSQPRHSACRSSRP